MAISIKNHEDRITALEKIGKDIKVKVLNPIHTNYTPAILCTSSECDGYDIILHNCTQSSSQSKDIYTTDYGRVPDNGPFDPNKIIVYGQSYISVLRHHRNKFVQSHQFTNVDHYYEDDYLMMDSAGNIKICSEQQNRPAPDNFVFIAILLKLYYNFSYNITREFYKVKFKLKHYLCSHLQKFI